MRIRKQAKLMLSGSGLGTHIRCKLNKNPWDAMTFPSSDRENLQPSIPDQFFRDDFPARNGSVGGPSGAPESALSMKAALNVTTHAADMKEKGMVRTQQGNKTGENDPVEKMPEAIYCCRTDTKSLQSKRSAKQELALCEDHNNVTHPTPKSPEKLWQNPRPIRENKASSSSNPYYYYTGFGPSIWGKESTDPLRGAKPEPTKPLEVNGEQRKKRARKLTKS